MKNDSTDVLQEETFATKSLTPSRSYLSHNDTGAVSSVRVEGNQLVWDDNSNDNARFYVIYAADEVAKDTMTDYAGNIVDRVMFNGAGTYTYDIPESNQDSVFAITVHDRAFVETEAVHSDQNNSTPLEFEVEHKAITLAFDETLSESEFIERLNITSNEPISVSTNFNDVVDVTVLKHIVWTLQYPEQVVI